MKNRDYTLIAKILVPSVSLIMIYLSSALLSSSASPAEEEVITSPSCPGERGYHFMNHESTQPSRGGFVSYDALIDSAPGELFLSSESAICGAAEIEGQVHIEGPVVIRDHAKVHGVADQTMIKGAITISGDAEIESGVKIIGRGVIKGSAHIKEHKTITGSKISLSGAPVRLARRPSAHTAHEPRRRAESRRSLASRAPSSSERSSTPESIRASGSATDEPPRALSGRAYGGGVDAQGVSLEYVDDPVIFFQSSRLFRRIGNIYRMVNEPLDHYDDHIGDVYPSPFYKRPVACQEIPEEALRTASATIMLNIDGIKDFKGHLSRLISTLPQSVRAEVESVLAGSPPPAYAEVRATGQMIELGELYISDECKRICEEAKRRAPGQAQLITAVLTIHFNVYDYLARALRGHDLLTLEVEQHLESLDLRGDTSYVHAIISVRNPHKE